MLPKAHGLPWGMKLGAEIRSPAPGCRSFRGDRAEGVRVERAPSRVIGVQNRAGTTAAHPPCGTDGSRTRFLLVDSQVSYRWTSVPSEHSLFQPARPPTEKAFRSRRRG